MVFGSEVGVARRTAAAFSAFACGAVAGLAVALTVLGTTWVAATPAGHAGGAR